MRIRAVIKEHIYFSEKDNKEHKEWHILICCNSKYSGCFVCDTKQEAELLANKINSPDILGIIADMKKERNGITDNFIWDIETLEELNRRANVK